MKKANVLFAFAALFLSLMAVSKGQVHQGDHDHRSNSNKVPKLQVPLTFGCRKALSDLKTCRAKMHENFLGKKQYGVKNICCKSILEFERSCFRHGVPHFVFPHWLSKHCSKINARKQMFPQPDNGAPPPDTPQDSVSVTVTITGAPPAKTIHLEAADPSLGSPEVVVPLAHAPTKLSDDQDHGVLAVAPSI